MHEPGVEGGEGTETGLRWVGPDHEPDTQAAAGGAERRSAAPKPSSSMALSRATMASRAAAASRTPWRVAADGRFASISRSTPGCCRTAAGAIAQSGLRRDRGPSC
jgi:hypothetical protein